MLEKGPNGFNKKLRTALTKAGFFVTQIESETGRGTPDIHASSIRSGPLWIECKVSRTKTKVSVKMRPDQIMWHEANRATKGAPSWIAVAAEMKGGTRFYLCRGELAREIANKWDHLFHFPTIEAMVAFFAQERA